MFAAVMMDPENCRHLLEMILNISIERVEVDIEKSIVYHPEYHGIRLDVFSKDEKNTRYSVEMQVNPTPVTQRSRYYHSEIDAGLLLAGLPTTIFRMPTLFSSAIMTRFRTGNTSIR